MPRGGSIDSGKMFESLLDSSPACALKLGKRGRCKISFSKRGLRAAICYILVRRFEGGKPVE